MITWFYNYCIVVCTLYNVRYFAQNSNRKKKKIARVETQIRRAKIRWELMSDVEKKYLKYLKTCVKTRTFSQCLFQIHNPLSNDLRLPNDHEYLSILSVSSSFPSPLSLSINPSHFHSRLKTHLFHKSFPP